MPQVAGKAYLITGGASLIGSPLADALWRSCRAEPKAEMPLEWRGPSDE